MHKQVSEETLSKFFSADVVEEEFSTEALPGSIVKVEQDRFYVKTGKELLAMTSMQFGSFFTGTSREFIKMLNPQIGERFL